MQFGVLHSLPKVFQRSESHVNREAPNSLVLILRCELGKFSTDASNIDMLVLTLSLLEQSRLAATATGHFRPFFTVNQDEAQIFMGCHCPFCSLSDLFDALVLEHLDEVLLDAAFDDGCVFFWWAVDDWGLVGDLLGVRGEELLPVLGVRQVKVHQKWVVRLLDIDPDISVANDRMDLPQWANGIRQPDIQVTRTSHFDPTELVWLYDVMEVVALASQWVPQLEAPISRISLTHHVDHQAVRQSASAHNIRLITFALFLVDVSEVVGEGDGVLLIIAPTQVKELLRGRPKIR